MNRAEFERVYAQYGGLVLRRAKAIMRDEAVAKDVMQDVFVRVLRAEAAFSKVASPMAWLAQATTHECLNRLRNSQRREQLHEAQGDGEEASRAAAPDERIDVARVLEHVGPELQAIAIAHYVDGLTHEEISEQLQVSRRTIGNRLDAFRRVARELEVHQ